MATTQASDPPTGATLRLSTSNTAPMILELWTKQAPLACRSFVQHALDGYYSGTTFHRLVPDFIVQGGDPTGSGYGGEAAYRAEDDPSYGTDYSFPIEAHSRLKFTRRGLLGMATSKDTGRCRSQFFLTLNAQGARELDGKMTVFGRVAAEGNGIYELVKLGEAETEEGSDRPLYPTKITGVEVIQEPFGLRRREKQHASEILKSSSAAKKPKTKAPKAKPIMLSFEGSDDERGMSIRRPAKRAKAKHSPEARNGADIHQSQQAEGEREHPLEVRRDEERLSSSGTSQAEPVLEETSICSSPPRSTTADSEQRSSSKRSKSSLEHINAEIEALKQSLRADANVTSLPDDDIRSTSLKCDRFRPHAKPLLEQLVGPLAPTTRGRKRGGTDEQSNKSEERKILAALAAFKDRLDKAAPAKCSELRASGKSGQASKEAAPDGKIHIPDAATGLTKQVLSPDLDDFKEENLCDLHFIPMSVCQSCRRAEGLRAESDGDVPPISDDVDQDWMSHRPQFAKDVRGKDLEWKKQHEFEDGLVTMEAKFQQKHAPLKGNLRSGRAKDRWK